MPAQDFSQKMVIVLRENLASWQLTNTVGHIAAYLGNRIGNLFATGESFVSKDGQVFPRNSQFPIINLRAPEQGLKKMIVELRETDLVWIAFLREMIEEIDDTVIETRLGVTDSNDIEVLGVGIFGSKEQVKLLTQSFKLWK